VILYEAVSEVLYSRAYDGLVGPFPQKYLSLMCFCRGALVLVCKTIISWSRSHGSELLRSINEGLFVMKMSMVLLPLIVKSTICSDEVSYIVSSMHWLMLFE